MILALDQSLNTSGYSIFDNNKLHNFGIYKNSAATEDISTRLLSFYQWLNSIVQEYGINTIYFEDIQYQNNKDTYKKLAYVQAIILLFIAQTDSIKKYKIMSPSHWRKIISDNYGIKFGKSRQEQKQKCLEFVKKQYPQFEMTEDEADSVALGTAAILEEKQEISDF